MKKRTNANLEMGFSDSSGHFKLRTFRSLDEVVNEWRWILDSLSRIVSDVIVT